MYNAIHLVSLADAEATEPTIAALHAAAPEARRLIAPTLPGTFNGGDIVAQFAFDDEAACNAARAQIEAALAGPAIRHVDSATYAGGQSRTQEPGLRGGVYRALLLSVDRPVKRHVIERFETETRAMPAYIPAIRNWRLSRVSEARGARRWTHVWEQEYADIGGLMGPYMMHPYHWGHVDRWFDPESPDWMVNTTLCHSFCSFETSIITD